MAYKDDNFYLEQIKQGNTDAYAMLINKHKTMAFNVALRVCRNREDAEEVIQDAFLKVYYSLKDFEGKSKFTTWLFRIVYNQAISKIRKKTIDQNTIDEEIIDNFTADEISNGLSYLKAKDQTKYINLALEKLTERRLCNCYLILSKRKFCGGGERDYRLKRSKCKSKIASQSQKTLRRT